MTEFRQTSIKRPPGLRSVFPLEPEERRSFVERVQAYVPSVYVTRKQLEEVWPWNPTRTVMLLYETGMHPDIIVHPDKRALHLTSSGEVLQWFRPKTKRLMNFPVQPSIKPWIAEYVASLVEREHKYVVQRYKPKDGVLRERQQDVCYLPVTHLVKRVCQEIGFDGVTPRGLRHTLADRVDEGSGHDLRAIQEYTGTAVDTAMRYNNRPRGKVGLMIANGELPK